MKVLDSFSLRSLHLIHLLPLLCHEVAANTEIINFSSSRGPTVDLPLNVLGNWSTLGPTENERRWSLEPAVLHMPLHRVCERTGDASVTSPHPPFSCPHELWLLLDLDDERWAPYSTFTLRVSWPASTPVDFAMSLYTPQDLLERLSEQGLLESSNAERGRTSTLTTRSRYARIRAVHAGVPTPGSRSHPHPPGLTTLPHVAPLVPEPVVPPATDADPPPHAARRGGETGGTVPFFVILEPTYFGVLPATLLHTVCFLVPIVLAAAAFFVPWVLAYVEPYAQQAREDLTSGVARTGKDR